MPPLAFLAIVIALQPINHIYFVNGKPHTWSKKSAALAGGEC